MESMILKRFITSILTLSLAMNGNISFASSQGTAIPVINEDEEKNLGEEETEVEEEEEDISSKLVTMLSDPNKQDRIEIKIIKKLQEIDTNSTFSKVFYEVLSSLVKKYDIDPKMLRLEITESIMMTDIEMKLQIIDKLRKDGFIVEMDDFGSGYSSLNLLKDMPVDILKIDMVFLRKTRDADRARIILQQIINMAQKLIIPVITEGVETEEQVGFLTDMGCEMFQGYYFARPIPLDEFEKKNHVA